MFLKRARLLFNRSTLPQFYNIFLYYSTVLFNDLILDYALSDNQHDGSNIYKDKNKKKFFVSILLQYHDFSL